MHMNFMKIVSLFLFLIFTITANGKVAKASLRTSEVLTNIEKGELLACHNTYRKALKIPPLTWSDELERVAQKWANHLAKRCDMIHSKDNPYGENIYWTSHTATPKKVVDSWASEEKYFNHRKRVYKGGVGRRYGHYTQIIWRKTTHLGGAKAKCHHGGEIWVCNYDPAGNYVDEKVY